ncbi:DUF2513 domain-containing protein [Salinicoccus roseus]|uniref:DUF2513 domain-containing protein n=1 Tax=Salinicoccus roseus TaxID=45670 RepID=UPI0035657E22
MEKPTQLKDLDRIIELGKHIRESERPNAFIEFVNERDFYQYYLMRDNGMIEFTYTVADGEYYFLNKVNLTNKGHDFLDTFENKDDYEEIKEFAKKKGKRLVDLPLDIAFKIGTKWLENQMGL